MQEAEVGGLYSEWAQAKPIFYLKNKLKQKPGWMI
jgi:hypothetical protein